MITISLAKSQINVIWEPDFRILPVGRRATVLLHEQAPATIACARDDSQAHPIGGWRVDTNPLEGVSKAHIQTWLRNNPFHGRDKDDLKSDIHHGSGDGLAVDHSQIIRG